MSKIFVCAGMGVAKNQNINEQATKLGKLLGNSNFTYVQGGSNSGLMGLTLQEFLKYSRSVEFFIPEIYYNYDAPKLIELTGQDNFHAIKTRGEADRLEKIKTCNRIIVLPGGTGTIEELLYCNETFRSKEHQNQISLVNIDGYFNGFIAQCKTNIQEGLSKSTAINFNIVNSIDEISFLANLNENDLTK